MEKERGMKRIEVLSPLIFPSAYQNLPNVPKTIIGFYLQYWFLCWLRIWLNFLIFAPHTQIAKTSFVLLGVFMSPQYWDLLFEKLPKWGRKLYAPFNIWLWAWFISANKFSSLLINTFKFIQITELSLNDCEWLVEILSFYALIIYLAIKKRLFKWLIVNDDLCLLY